MDRSAIGRAVRAGRVVGRAAVAAGLGFHPDLRIRADPERRDHRGAPVRAVPHRALARATGAGRRLCVHRRGHHCARADLPRAVLGHRAVRRRPADHGLDLHVLARRLSARGARLRADARPADRVDGIARQWCEPTGAADLCVGCGRGSRFCRLVDRRPAAADHARQPLHADHVLGGVAGVGLQPGGVGRVVVAAPALYRARPVAVGGDVRLAVRHRTGRAVEQADASISAFTPAASMA